ncbi:MAG: rod shape-determining protein [Clostridia bacterium]|nr:rod shape-determining protein [Clostridia bacterium]
MIKLAIDLGSSVTKIYRADTNNGVVLSEPSCVAVVGNDQEVKAIGKDARNLIGKTAEFTSIVYPIYEGEVVDMRLATVMLKEFLNRIDVKGYALRWAQVLISVPCGISTDALAEYRKLAEECGFRRAWFVEQPYLSALGAGAVLGGDPVFCLDIGGGVANAAVVSTDGIIAGISMNGGGNKMDANIITKVSDQYKLLIGALTAERVKNEIGSLAPVVGGGATAQGSSTETYKPASAHVQASDITECIRVYIQKIVEYATTVLWELPAEVAATVNKNGVYLSGGVMKIPYVAQYIGAQLGMRFRVCEEPQYATVLGGGVLLREKELLYRFAKRFD